jgi:hypothetical protein
MSAGGLIGMGINVLIVGFLSFVIGRIIDIIINVVNAAGTLSGLPQDALNTIYYLKLGYIAVPFLYLLFILVNHIIISNNESNRVV